MAQPYKPCDACKVGRTRGRFCAPCIAAKKDQESAWDLGEGEWVTRKGKQVWVPAEPTARDEAGKRKCQECPETFVPKRRQIYCGQRCKTKAENRRRMARKKAAVG